MAREFRTVNLAINLAARHINPGGDATDCDSGSTFCWSPTVGCGAAGASCLGGSTSVVDLEAIVSLPAAELENFQKELNAVIAKFANKKGPG